MTADTHRQGTTSTPKDRRGKRSRQLTSTQVMFAVILTVGLMLAINFSSRIIADRDLHNIRAAVLQEIELLRREQGELIAELEYVKSDAYVEQWARSEGRMVREGMVLVMPKPAGPVEQPTPVVVEAAEAETTLPRREPWQLWWSLFFDIEPPEF